MRVAVIDGPAGYLKALPNVPEGAVFQELGSAEQPPNAEMILWFFHDPVSFQQSFRGLRHAAGNSRVWVLWRKGLKRNEHAYEEQERTQDSHKLDGMTIRRTILEMGLVDYKVCRFNDTWSAMAVTRKKQ